MSDKEWIVMREARIKCFALVSAETGSKAISAARKMPDSEFQISIKFLNWTWRVRRYKPENRHKELEKRIIDKIIGETENGKEEKLAEN